jgi:hypothetical protein
MFSKPGSTKAVEMLTVNDELKDAVVVAEASTKAMGRAILTGTIPIIEFGLVIAFALLIANVPLKIIRRINNG